MTLTFKQIKNRGDVWGEMFRFPKSFSKAIGVLDSYAFRSKIQRNVRYYKFTFHVGGFGHVTRRKTRYGKAFLEKQRMKLFYGSLTDKQLRILWKTAANRFGSTDGAFLHFMESLAHLVVYRANWAFNVRDAKAMVEAGFFCINGQRILKVKRLHVGDMLTPYNKEFTKGLVLKFLKMGFRFFPPPVHLLFNYDAMLVYYQGFGDVPPFYPVKTDLKRINQVYY